MGISNDHSEVTWEIKPPLALNPQDPADWLIPLTEMRGYVLYENGLRPFFKVGPNQFSDKDDFDLSSYHILAKIDNRIVGCARLLPLSSDFNCVTSQIVGKKIFTAVLFNFLKDVKGAEANRWIVHPDYTRRLIGYYLMYATWALANHLGFKMIANSGQHTQDLINHYGAIRPQDGFKTYYSEKYNDHVSILYFDENKLSKRAHRAIQKMNHVLGLTESLATHDKFAWIDKAMNVNINF